MPRKKKEASATENVPKKPPGRGTKRLKQSSTGDCAQPDKKMKLNSSTEDATTNNTQVEAANDQGAFFVIQEIEEIEVFVCAKCEKNFNTIAEMKQHLPQCRTRMLNQTLAERPPAEDVTHVVLDMSGEILNNSIDLETPVDFEGDYDVEPEELKHYESHDNADNCFCCDEPMESAHAGHIRCGNCVKSFRSGEQLRRHQVILHSRLPDAIQCTQCNAVVATKKLLKLHIDSHMAGKQFSCKSCGKDFTRKYHLDRHMKFLNCDGTRTVIKYPCNVCNQTFARMDNLREHLKQHINPVEKQKDFQCPFCEKAFVGSSLLNIHIRTHTGERPFICDICKGNFPSNAALRKHRRTHTGEKPYQCPHCESRFAARETMNRHIKRHTGEKKYACTLCDARFIQNSQLKNHMRIHDDSITFDCKLCNEKCRTQRALAIHRRKAHKIGVTYKCDDCGNVYVTKSELVRHLTAIHLRLKDFECDVCRKRFVTKSQVLVHRNIHNKESPVKCRLCGTILLRKDCYRRHIRERHSDVFKRIIQQAEKRKVEQLQNRASLENHRNDAASTAEPEEVYQIYEVNEKEEVQEPSPEDVEILYEVNLNSAGEGELIIPDEIADNYAESTLERVAFEGLSDQIPLMKVKPSLSFKELIQFTTKLMEALLEQSTLTEFDHPATPIDQVLEQIIENCGNQPFKEPDCDKSTEIREHIKQFFALVMDNSNIQELLNNHSVDEVVQYIVKYLTADYN